MKSGRKRGKMASKITPILSFSSVYSQNPLLFIKIGVFRGLLEETEAAVKKNMNFFLKKT
jgi:hypothetical protein